MVDCFRTLKLFECLQAVKTPACHPEVTRDLKLAVKKNIVINKDICTMPSNLLNVQERDTTEDDSST